MNKMLFKLLWLSMLAGAVFVVLAFGESLGLLATMFVYLLLTIFFITYRDAGKFNIKRGFLFLAAILLLGLSYTIHSNVLYMVLNFFCIIGLGTVYSIHMSEKRSFSVSFSWLVKVIEHVFSPLGEFHIPFKIINSKFAYVKIKNLNTKTKGIILGIIVSIPLLLLMIFLLASADQVFNSFISIDLKFFESVFSGANIMKLILWFFTTLYTFSYFYYILHKPKKNIDKDDSVRLAKPINEKQTLFSDKNIKEVMIITVLILINILFLFFTFIQFRYLFSSSVITFSREFTYSSYARRGFFELTLISVINLGLIVFLSNHSKEKINNILMSLLAANTLVIAYSALFRMNLYILAYGYTWLRVVSFSFIVLQVLLLIITLYHIWKRKFDIKVVILTVYLTSYILLNYVNIDSMIVKGNVNRYLEGSTLDAQYFNGLSYSSVSTLMDYEELFEGKAEHASAKEKISEVISSKQHEISYTSRKWYHFNLSEFIARRKLNVK